MFDCGCLQKFSLPEFMNFKLFGKTILVVNIKFGPFFGPSTQVSGGSSPVYRAEANGSNAGCRIGRRVENGEWGGAVFFFLVFWAGGGGGGDVFFLAFLFVLSCSQT